MVGENTDIKEKADGNSVSENNVYTVSEIGESRIPSDIQKYELKSFFDYLALILVSIVSGFLRGLFGAGVSFFISV